MSQLQNRSDEDKIFDRKLLRTRRNRAAERIDDYDFLFNEVADNIKYRLSVVKKPLSRALFIGDVRSKFSSNLETNWGMEHVITMDMAEKFEPNVVADEENMPFAPASFDAVITMLTMHWVNDIHTAFKQVRNILKPDGLFTGAMLGGTTLRELRHSLMQAEDEIFGKSNQRIIPFMDPYDLSRLFGRHGFQIPVVDNEVLTVQYSDIFRLLEDLRGMGASNIMTDIAGRSLSRKTLDRANEIYKRDYGDADGMIPASFDVVYFSAWTAGSQHIVNA